MQVLRRKEIIQGRDIPSLYNNYYVIFQILGLLFAFVIIFFSYRQHQLIALAIYSLILSIFDIFFRKVPNGLTLPIILFGLIYRIVINPSSLLIPLAMLFILLFISMKFPMGMGDIKGIFGMALITDGQTMIYMWIFLFSFLLLFSLVMTILQKKSIAVVVHQAIFGDIAIEKQGKGVPILAFSFPAFLATVLVGVIK